jgi:hypothetical protein
VYKRQLKSFGDGAKKIGKSLGGAFAAVGIGLSIAGLKQLAQASIDDSKSQALLARSMKNVSKATDAQVAGAEEYIKKLQLQTAIMDDDLRPAFGVMFRASKDLAESQHLLSIATDVSAGTGKDLQTVSVAIAKAYGGQYTALQKLIPGIKNAKNPIGELEKSFKGLAETAANQNPFARMQIIIADVQERLGAVLIPYLEKLSEWLATPQGSERLDKVIGQMATILDMAGQITLGIGDFFKDPGTGGQRGFTDLGTFFSSWWDGFKRDLYDISRQPLVRANELISDTRRAIIPTPTARTTTPGIFGDWKTPKIGGIDKSKMAIEKAIQTLKTTLDMVQQTFKDFSDKFRNSVELSFGIVEQGVRKVFRPDKVLREMRRIQEATKNFNANLETLKAAGGTDGKSLIEQILGLPPEEAAAVAAAYVQDIGTFKDTIAVGGQLASTGTTAGKFANNLAGNQTQEQLLNEMKLLRNDLKTGKNTYNIKSEMTATEIVNSIKKWERSTGRKVLI